MLIPLERQLNALQLAAGSFYIMKICSRLFVLHCRSRPKYDRYILIPIFRKFVGGVEPWSMARWKALAELLLAFLLFGSVRQITLVIRQLLCAR